MAAWNHQSWQSSLSFFRNCCSRCCLWWSVYSWECNGDVIEIGLGLCLWRWGKARKREEEEKALEKGQEGLNTSRISFQHHCLHSMAFNGCFCDCGSKLQLGWYQLSIFVALFYFCNHWCCIHWRCIIEGSVSLARCSWCAAPPVAAGQLGQLSWTFQLGQLSSAWSTWLWCSTL